MLKKVLPALLLLLVVSSCSKEQFKAEIPSYLHIEAIDLETESYEGSDSQKITDAWVTMDGNFLGAFELPAIVPILAEGEHEFRISSGIKANGISATRIMYPFFETCDLFVQGGETYQVAVSNIVNLYRDSTVVVKARTSYTENAEFLFIEGFEDAGAILKTSEDSDTSLIKTNVDSLVFEGYGSGEIHLDSTNDFFELISSEFISLNSLYNATMLEMDYRCDHSFKLGVAVRSKDTGVINRFESMQISPSDDWNKIYVHMTNQVNLGNSTDEFGIFIGAVKSTSSEKASFYFDNIKWLHEQ